MGFKGMHSRKRENGRSVKLSSHKVERGRVCSVCTIGKRRRVGVCYYLSVKEKEKVSVK